MLVITPVPGFPIWNYWEIPEFSTWHTYQEERRRAMKFFLHQNVASPGLDFDLLLHIWPIADGLAPRDFDSWDVLSGMSNRQDKQQLTILW